MRLIYFLLAIAIFCGAQSALAAPAAHVVISEVQVSGLSGFSTDEFVELYNPTDTPVDLTGWSVVKRTASGVAYPLVTTLEAQTIGAHGYLLIAHSTGYTGSVTPDLRYDTANSLAADNSVEVTNALGIVDRVGWGKATGGEGALAPTPGSAKSIERKALPTSTSESLADGGEDAFRGNGEDTDTNEQDWVGRSTPEPQAQSAELEFVTAPAPSKPSIPSPSVPAPVPAPATVAPIAPVTSAAPHHVVLSEILPDPAGPDSEAEFIEIQNTGEVSVELAGWKLNDTSKAGHTFITGAILPGAWLTVQRSASGIALNNTGGETVTLTAPDGVVTSTISWKGTAPESQSYALVKEAWQWTRQLTPGKANVYEDPNRAPVAVIRDGEPTVRVRAAVEFSAADSTDPDGDDLEFRWKFSDGATASGTNVRHTFQKAGKVTATLTAVDPSGKSSTATVTLTVQDYDRSTKVSISAAMPNPAEGEEEWVELQSTEARPVDVAGWTLRLGKKLTPLDGTLVSKATRRWGEDALRFALRNDGGTLELLNAEGAVVSTLQYGKTARGEIVQPGGAAPAVVPAAPVESPGAVAGATTSRAEATPATAPPASQEFPRWVWLAVAAGAGMLWSGYALWQRRRSSTP